MLSSHLFRLARLDSLRPDVIPSCRAVVFSFGARFLDDVTRGGIWLVLGPVLRWALRFGLAEASLLAVALRAAAMLAAPSAERGR